MNKTDFFDLLNDYLRKYYSVEETQEILRDYEEYFINGKLDKKTEEEIVAELGSPKKIALSLVDEDGRSTDGRLQSWRNRFYQWYENRFWKNIQRKAESVEHHQAGVMRRLGYILQFIAKNVFLIVLHLLVILIVATLLSFWMTLVGLTVSGILLAVFLTPVAISGFSFLSMSYLWIFFPVVLAVGLALLMGYLIIGLGKLIYRFIVEYIHWVKLQMMYKKAKNRSNDELINVKEKEV